MMKLNKENIEDILALTPMQEGMIFHYLKNPQNDYYFEQLSLSIKGEIDVELFEKSWNFVIETNEMLRTVFYREKLEKPVQIFLKEHKLQPIYYDFSFRNFNEKKKLLEKIKIRDRKESFHLQKAEVPFRVTLCKFDESEYEMLISNHHILYDGWSNGIILEEFLSAYNALYYNKPLKKKNKSKFKEFVKWIQNQDIKKQEMFWKEYLKYFNKNRSTFITPLTLTSGKSAMEIMNFKVKFRRDFTRDVKQFVKERKITMAVLFYSTWAILIHKYSGNHFFF